MVKRPPKPTFLHVWKTSIKPLIEELEVDSKVLSICNTFMCKLWDLKTKYGGQVTRELVENVRKEIEHILSRHSDVDREKLREALVRVAKAFGIEIS